LQKGHPLQRKKNVWQHLHLSFSKKRLLKNERGDKTKVEVVSIKVLKEGERERLTGSRLPKNNRLDTTQMKYLIARVTHRGRKKPGCEKGSKKSRSKERRPEGAEKEKKKRLPDYRNWRNPARFENKAPL